MTTFTKNASQCDTLGRDAAMLPSWLGVHRLLALASDVARWLWPRTTQIRVAPMNPEWLEHHERDWNQHRSDP